MSDEEILSNVESKVDVQSDADDGGGAVQTSFEDMAVQVSDTEVSVSDAAMVGEVGSVSESKGGEDSKVVPTKESTNNEPEADAAVEESLPVMQVEEAIHPVSDSLGDTPLKEGTVAAVPEKIIEKIVEVERVLTEVDKESIYKQKLTEGLHKANAAKSANYEKHLQEIVDFIRARGTLVTNQEIEEGLKIPDATVTYRLDELMQRGLVIRLGSGFDAKYRLKDAV